MRRGWDHTQYTHRNLYSSVLIHNIPFKLIDNENSYFIPPKWHFPFSYFELVNPLS
jgi:hypothetical protein